MQINKYYQSMPANKIQDIHERIYQFVIRVLNLAKNLPKTPENIIIIKQIARSGTSMGANDQEADGTDSRRDFIAKYAIVRKEGKETNYWLRIIADTNPSFKSRMKDLQQEGKELVKIISAIILSAKGIRNKQMANNPINKSIF